MKKINGNLTIEKGDTKDYSQLTEVSGYVEVRQGATFTAPLLADHLFKCGYKNLFEYHHTNKFPAGIYVTLNEKEVDYLIRLKPIIKANRLYMGHWHSDGNWKGQSLEKIIHECKTTHCVAGWIQIFEKDKYNDITAEQAGRQCAPNLAQFFHETNERVELVVKTLLG